MSIQFSIIEFYEISKTHSKKLDNTSVLLSNKKVILKPRRRMKPFHHRRVNVTYGLLKTVVTYLINSLLFQGQYLFRLFLL